MSFGIARGKQPRDRAPNVPIKDHSPNRREWMAAKAARSHETIVADALRASSSGGARAGQDSIAVDH